MMSDGTGAGSGRRKRRSPAPGLISSVALAVAAPPAVRFSADTCVELGLYPQGNSHASIVVVLGADSAESARTVCNRLHQAGLTATVFLDPAVAEQLPPPAGIGGFELALVSGPGWREALSRLARAGYDPAGMLETGEEGRPPDEALAYRALPGAAQPRVAFRPGGRGSITVELPDSTGEELEEFAARAALAREDGGILIETVDLSGLPEGTEGLDRLDRRAAVLAGGKGWNTTLREFSRWWIPRREVTVAAGVRGETLEIVCRNPSSYPLKNAEFHIAPSCPARFYRISDQGGRVSAEGLVPPERNVAATLAGESGAGGIAP
ncbi:MAG TPA: hypothetical protein PLI51_07950 [bacterium]|nr:hypothetical protein [bacterium]HPQ66641.1 hypothetical protein [bacterium]